jgi:hypothetical protein
VNIRTQQEEASMKRIVMAVLLGIFATGSQADQRFSTGGVDVNIPPEIFSSSGQRPPPCNQCCIYQDQNYSEGSVVKAEGVLLQCQRDPQAISTNPLVWRRVRE